MSRTRGGRKQQDTVRLHRRRRSGQGAPASSRSHGEPIQSQQGEVLAALPAAGTEEREAIVEKILDRAAEIFTSDDGQEFVMWEGHTVPYYCQGDPAWADRTLGTTQSIAAAGCAITSLAMILGFYGRDVDPAVLDDYLDQNSGYYGDAVAWDVALRCGEVDGGPELRYAQKLELDEDSLWETIDDRLEQGHPTLIRVDYRGDSSYDHFCVVVGRDSEGRHLINDPGTSSGAATEDSSTANAVFETHELGYRLVAVDLIKVA